jgi:hypothetical protein
MTRLPRTPDELTSEWLSAALGRTVESVGIVDVIWGTATKVFLAPKYALGQDGPERICAKGGFDARLAGFGLGDAYTLEAQFFANLAPTLDIPLPACYYAEAEGGGEQAVVLLEDLNETGVRFGEPTAPWTVDAVASALEVLAALHGQTWGSTRPKLGDWIEVGSRSVRTTAQVLLGAEHWAAQRALEGGPSLPAESKREGYLQAFRKLWELGDAADLCVAHGDAHIGNTYVDSRARPGFVDWQCVCLGPWSYDVAYFVGGALEINDRRRSERDLLRHYLQALVVAGGPALDDEAAWLDYRRHALHGFLWVLTPPVMQPLERINTMAQRHLAHIEDLESLVAIGA